MSTSCRHWRYNKQVGNNQGEGRGTVGEGRYLGKTGKHIHFFFLVERLSQWSKVGREMVFDAGERNTREEMRRREGCWLTNINVEERSSLLPTWSQVLLLCYYYCCYLLAMRDDDDDVAFFSLPVGFQ